MKKLSLIFITIITIYANGLFANFIERNRDVLFEQSIVMPDDPVDWDFTISDDYSSAPFYVADNFSGVEGTIESITFYGFPSRNGVQVEEDPMGFDIIFYEDVNGEMGEIVSTQSVNGYCTEVEGVVYSYIYHLFEWNIDLETPVQMNSGWFSIVGTSQMEPDAVFTWGNSADGDGIEWFHNTAGWNTTDSDRNFTFFGSLEPAELNPPTNLVVTVDENISNTVHLEWEAPEINTPTYIEENFDNSDELPEGWSVVDNDGDTYSWEVSTGWGGYNDSEHCMTSASYINSDIGPLTPDNWLISPAVYVEEGAELRFFDAAAFPDLAGEHYYVKISTTDNNVGSFSYILLERIVSSAEYEEHVIDLSNYVGETIYIAWQHCFVTDVFFMNIDNVSIGVQNNRSLNGYKIYRDQAVLAEVDASNLSYTDEEVENGEHSYYVTALYSEGESAPSNEVNILIDATSIDENTYNVISNITCYPNPFNMSNNSRSQLSTISFDLDRSISNAELAVYNIKGQKVISIYNGDIQSGKHSFTWNGKDSDNNDVATGIYFYRLSNGKVSYSKKMTIIK